MKQSKRAITVLAVIAGVITISGAAFALSGTDFDARAKKWADATCTQTLLNSKNTSANNTTIAICNAYMKSNENTAAIGNQQLSIDDLLSRSAVPGPKGDKGDTGEQGIQGVQGTPGNDATAKILVLYDNTNTLLGINPTLGDPQNSNSSIRFYNEQLGRFAAVDQLGNFQKYNVYFETTNCIGVAYISSGNQPILANFYLQLIKNSAGYYYITDNASSPFNTVTLSYRDANGVCTNSGTSGKVMKLVQVSVPFSDPVTLPLQIQYQ